MWEIYDALLAEIPDDSIVEAAVSGSIWTALQTAQGVGVAMSLHEQTRPPLMQGAVSGKRLRAVAEGIKSWHFAEASLGLAAINAWYNRPEAVRALGMLSGETCAERDAFLTYQQAVAGKKVAVVGHFPYLEKRFAPLCELSILERKPQAGDYPDTACEFLLPEQDYVFITGATFVNKTLPRLLTLARRAVVVLVGPSVPMAPVLSRFGVAALEGFVVEQPARCMDVVAGETCHPIFSSGRMVSLACAAQERSKTLQEERT